MPSHVQALVIGGGVVGCSVLYHLARSGWTDVLLVERSELTSGSSWHAAGGFHTLNGDPNVARLQAYTVSLYDELEKLSGQSCSLHLTGGIMLADSPERMDFLRHVHASGRTLGMQTEIITPGEARSLFPLMNESHFVGALWDPVEGHLDPSGTTHAYAKSAQKLGARISLRNRVTGLSALADGWEVSTEQGCIQAEHVINAGGLWAREVGRMAGLELPVLAMEHMYLLTDTMPEVMEFNQGTGRELVGVIDFKGEIYTRQERDGLLLGTYERDCRAWAPLETPWDFGHELLQPDLERISPSLEIAFRHFPAFEQAGIRQTINGPFTFAPDGNPLVGPVQGLRNYWCACAVMAGFSQAGGVGLVLSNWMVNGDPEYDVFGMDVARYGDFTSLRYTNAKVRENYSRRFSIRFPNEELPAARPQQTTPLYDIMVRDNHAVMGDSWGLETPLWFAPDEESAHDMPSFHRSNDFIHVRREVEAVRTCAGVTEIANFAKYRISGRDAERWLDSLMTNHLPVEGRMVLSPMLNESGKLIGDFTIARTAECSFMLWGSSAAQIYHMRWFEQQLPVDSDVTIERLGQRLLGLALAGPRSREILSSLVDESVSNTDFRFMETRAMDVAACPCRVNRISYTGELGYEIWMEPAYERQVYLAVKAAGEPLGLLDFGMRALLSMRLEKNFPTWFAELRPLYGPFEGGMDRFVKLDKTSFMGRARALAEHQSGPRLRRVSLCVDTTDTDAMGDEPVWAKVGDRDPGCVDPPHELGASRYDARGQSCLPVDAQRDGDWRVVGWVTSGGYGHSVRMSLAQAYLPSSLVQGNEVPALQVEILGHRYAAHYLEKPPFDAGGTRMRS
ncbi:MAG: FAD-dependent oxidoreductase [Granulosicoccus sp.]|nr:FAD-dependent oxidoreductase [Granulosicoccus sp.]